MYKVAMQRWIQGKIGPKDIDLLVKTKHLTAVQGATIKATERLVPYIEPIEEPRAENVSN
ncbi:MAG: hypothetical protein EB117_12670 [Betaproteobacteria bacterium]|nr:hypothetical protein [Betaproteobacteria bacterium]